MNSGRTIQLSETDGVNEDGSRRGNIIARHCRKGMSLELRALDTATAGVAGVGAYVRVPLLFGLLGSRLRQIGVIARDTDSILGRRLTRGHRISAMVVSVSPATGNGKSRVGIALSYVDFPPSR